MHREQPRLALDHHGADFVLAFADKRDSCAGLLARELTDPLGAGAGLAGAAPAEHEPGVPVRPAVRAFGGQLMPMRKIGEACEVILNLRRSPIVRVLRDRLRGARLVEHRQTR